MTVLYKKENNIKSLNFSDIQILKNIDIIPLVLEEKNENKNVKELIRKKALSATKGPLKYLNRDMNCAISKDTNDVFLIA